MVLAAILAVIVANSPAYEVVAHALETSVGFVIGPLTVEI
jgi:NhaA family Na+:H+ antiporter